MQLFRYACLATFIFVSACGGGGSSSDAVDRGDDGGSKDNAPVAVILAPGNASIGMALVLDGTSSSDPDGDVLTYHWTLTNIPASSTAHFDSTVSARPKFTPDVAGSYAVHLRVTSNNLSHSTNATIDVLPGNVAPNANAGADQIVLTGTVVTLDASQSSDPDGDAITYTS